MGVFAISRREQFCRNPVVEFDHRHGLKPRSDHDQRTRPVDSYGGGIAIHRKNVATSERRNAVPIAFHHHKRQTFAGDWGARETGTENLRRLEIRSLGI